MRILLVDHLRKNANVLKEALESEGFVVDSWLTPGRALRHLIVNSVDYDAAVVSGSIPQRFASHLCQTLRENHITIPILLTTQSHKPRQIVDGLNAGADDCIEEPFSTAELAARLRSILRRPKEMRPLVLRWGRLTLDPAKQKVTYRRKVIHLTLKEYMILHYLLLHPNEVITRERLTAHVWDEEYVSFSNVVDVHIKNVRRKLGPTGKRVIQGVYGVGYRLTAEPGFTRSS